MANRDFKTKKQAIGYLNQLADLPKRIDYNYKLVKSRGKRRYFSAQSCFLQI